ncbi:MAG: hypothetical protein V3W41_05865, partial [Planctomycetota bacterium]
ASAPMGREFTLRPTQADILCGPLENPRRRKGRGCALIQLLRIRAATAPTKKHRITTYWESSSMAVTKDVTKGALRGYRLASLC